MKNTLFLMLCGATMAVAGELPADVPVLPLAPEESKPLDLTLQFGIMHTENQDYYEPVDKLSLIPAVLYGASLSGQWEVYAQDKSSHHVGLSIGYYTGDENLSLGSFGITTLRTTATIDVMPILLTYNYEYRINDRISVFAGVRGGAVIRKTSFENSVFDYSAYGMGKYTMNDSSTKVLPTASIGVGAKVAFTENAALEIGYDFGWTFGKDCGDIHARCDLPGQATQDAIFNKQYYAKDNRYYGTVKVGFSFSF